MLGFDLFASMLFVVYLKVLKKQLHSSSVDVCQIMIYNVLRESGRVLEYHVDR